MLLIPFLTLLLFLGLEITIVLRTKMHVLERLSVSYLLGIGFLTFFVFLIDFIFNLDFSSTNTFIILISLCFALFVFDYRGIGNFVKDIKFKRPKVRLDKKTFFWGFILTIFVYTLLVNLFWPISDWDALVLYDFRAKLFLTDTDLIHAALSNGYFLSYPLLTSLTHLFVYQIGLSNPKFVYSLFYLSFVAIFYYSLRRSVSESRAMFFTVIFSLVPEIFSHATVAYTNLTYAVYLCSGIFYLYIWIKNKERSYLLLSVLLVGLSYWTRSAEPFWIVPLLIVFLTTMKNKNWKEFVYYFIVILFFHLPWKIFLHNINKITMPSSNVNVLRYLDILKGVSFKGIFLVVNYVHKHIFSTWGLIFVAFILLFIRPAFHWKRKNNLFLYITLSLFVLIFAGTLIFSIGYPEWQDISDSARRMSMFLLPLMIYSIALGTNYEKHER